MLNENSHLNSLFEHATEGFVVTGDEGNIVMVNPSACKMFGYTADELKGKHIEVLVPSEYRKGHIKLRESFYETPQNRVMGHGRDLHGQRKNGEKFPVEVSLSTYMRDNQRYAIAFIVEITHRKEIERSMVNQQKQLEKISSEMKRLNLELEAKVEERTLILKEALQRLERSQEELSDALDKERQLNEIKSRFVSMASHEFRTPLSTVLSSATLLSKYKGADEQPNRDRHIQKIKGSVKHLNDLLEDFLSLGKLNEGKVDVSYSTFNLREVALETIEEMKGLINADQKIIYNHKGNELIQIDRKLVKNILINLISNAKKFSEKGTTVEVDTAISHDQAMIRVTDHGIGISEEDQQHLFSSFFRGKNVLNIEGTGLGLHIVKRYLDLVNGNVELKSKLGEGTTITIFIPLNHS